MTLTYDFSSDVRDDYDYTGLTLVTWDSSAEPSGSGSGSDESSGSGSGSGTSNPPPVVYPYTIEREMDNHVTGYKNWSSGGSATFTRTTNSSSGSSGSSTGTGTESECLKGVRNRFVDTLERFWYF